MAHVSHPEKRELLELPYLFWSELLLIGRLRGWSSGGCLYYIGGMR